METALLILAPAWTFCSLAWFVMLEVRVRRYERLLEIHAEEIVKGMR